MADLPAERLQMDPPFSFVGLDVFGPWEMNSRRTTHEVLVTFMSEVTAIINARPLVPVSTDPEFPFILTPSMLLTQKPGNLTTPQEDFSKKDMLQSQWKRVQALAEMFWNR